jgi:hypothetical protein
MDDTALSNETLREHRNWFLEVQARIPNYEKRKDQLVRDRIAQIEAELDARKNDQRGDAMHRETVALAQKSIGIGQNTLCWTKVAAWAAIVGAAAAIGALLLNIPLSKLLPATSSQPSPTSSPQRTATASP